MEKQLRSLTLRSAEAYTTRTETFEDREYLVVPVVALVETVIFASNAEVPELVTEEEFSKAPVGWNGRPVFHGHPQVDGVYVSGNTPGLLETQQIGIVFNTNVADSKLKMEAWIDVKKAEEVAPELLTRIAEGEVVQISVGLSVATLNQSGIFQGKEYKGVWTEMVPDHLALLPADQIGACSVEAGCGIRAAVQGDSMSEPKNVVTRLLQRMGDALRAARSAGDMTANDVRMKLDQAIRALDPRVYYVDDYAPGKGEVYYSVYADGKYECYSRKYTLAADGTVTISGDPVEVEPVLSYEPVSTTQVTAAAAAAEVPAAAAVEEPKTTAATAPCSCQHPKAEAVAPVVSASNNEESVNMELKDITEKLAGATPEQLASIAQVFEPAAAAAPAAAAPAVAAATAAPALTAEQQEALELGTRTLRAAKAAAIKALKDSGRCKISDDRLNAMSQTALDELVALTGVEASAPAAVDYGLNGAPRAASQVDEEVPAPPDMVAGMRAARSFKDQPATK